MELVFGMAWEFNSYEPSSPKVYGELLNNAVLKVSRISEDEELVDLVVAPLSHISQALPPAFKKEGSPDWYMFHHGEDLLRLRISVPAWVRIIWKRTPT